MPTPIQSSKISKMSPLSVFGDKSLNMSHMEAALAEMIKENANDPAFEMFIKTFNESDGDIMQLMSRTHAPVDLREFVESDYFLNLKVLDEVVDGKEYGGGVWYPVFEACQEIVDGKFVENLFVGAIGTGKTSGAQIVTAYNNYLISTFVSPHMQFGIIPKNDIYYVMLNTTDDLATRVTYKGYKGLIENSPYFNEVFPYDKYVSSTLRFPKKIMVAPFAAFATKIMGMDVMGGIVDEMNFMQIVKKSKKTKDGSDFRQATDIYRKLVRRLKSRFDTEDTDAPIGICLVSSKNYKGDFTEKRQTDAIRENMERDALNKKPQTYIYDKAQWEAKPDPKFKEGTPFIVEVGDGRFPTRVLGENDVPRDGAELIPVPECFYTDFIQDPDGALADFAGKNAGSNDAFFYDRTKIWGMDDNWNKINKDDFSGIMRTPFTVDTFRLDQGWPELDPDYVVINPDRPRAAHIDLAVSGDAVGIAVGHVWKISNGQVRDRMTGELTVEAFPHIIYDQVLVARPPRAGQIELAEIRAIIYFLRDTVGIPIRWVTYDGFQSIDSRQILRKQGFKTDYISVENVTAYGPFRTAMFFHNRIYCKKHQVVFDELSEVVEDPETGKVDHPALGSKDGADGMVGVFTMLMKTPSSWKSELAEIDPAISARPIADRLTDREKEVLGEYVTKTPPPGSLAARILSNAEGGRRSVGNRRSTRSSLSFKKTGS